MPDPDSDSTSGDSHPVARSRRRHRVLRLFAALSVIASICSLASRNWWIADLASNLRIQILLSLAVAAIGLLIVRQFPLATVVTACICWHATWLWPFVLHPAKPAAGKVLKVCTVNVLTYNSQHDRILECLRKADPDVIAVLELSTSLENRMNEEFQQTYPYQITEPDDLGNFGIGLWSRFPLTESKIFQLTEPIVPSIEVLTEWQNQSVRIIATHPIPPVSSRHFQARNRHLNLLANRVRKLTQENSQTPIIVVGDLNLTPWSPWYDTFLNESGLQDTLRGDGLASLTPTWYRWSLFPFGLVLDHGFWSGPLDCVKRTVLEDIGSDHRPVLLEFSLSEKESN